MTFDNKFHSVRVVRKVSVTFLVLVVLKDVQAKVGDPCCKIPHCPRPQETCNADSLCECSPDYFRDATDPDNITCKKKGLGGDPCSETNPCIEGRGLVCVSGTCTCSSPARYYNPKMEKCVSQLGYGEECDPDLPNNIVQCNPKERLQCVDKYQQSRCDCGEGYFYFYDSYSCMRQANVGEDCGPISIAPEWCREGLICDDSDGEYYGRVCSCPDGQNYDSVTDQCL